MIVVVASVVLLLSWYIGGVKVVVVTSVVL
jgi:hypothetical protein